MFGGDRPCENHDSENHTRTWSKKRNVSRYEYRKRRHEDPSMSIVGQKWNNWTTKYDKRRLRITGYGSTRFWSVFCISSAIVYLMEKFIIRVQNFLIILLSRYVTCRKLRDWTNVISRLRMLMHLWEICSNV